MTSVDRRSSRAWALGALIGVIVLGFQPFFLKALKLDREVMVRQYDALPYRRLPGMQRVDEKAPRLIPRDEPVAFWTPYGKWWDGYSFSYMRASYLLAEYRLVPLVGQDDRAHPEVLGQLDWLVAIGGTPEVDGFETVMSLEGGALLRKVR